MEMLTDISIRTTKNSKLKDANLETVEFGQYISDHMLLCDFADSQWQQPQILPFANLSINPAALALHYGQTVFEGMKAFKMKDGRVNVFRADRHYERFVRSLDRMCMPAPPRELFIEGLLKLVALDKGWIPGQRGASLYLRPFMYASEAKMGVKISDEYRFIIFTGPVPELYAQPIRVKVETEYIRAAKGGTGFAKCGGNYGGAFYPTALAREQGYEQVLWTDGKEDPSIEESGMMNVMFLIDNVLVTPPLSDSILDGVTRNSLLTLAKDMGYDIAERPVSVAELETAFRKNRITEAFGAGTAAVVAPIATINIGGIDFQLPVYGPDSVLNKLKRKLEQIRTGVVPDEYGWNFIA